MGWLLWTMMWACGADGQPAGAPRGVIILSMDTVRWDHTSLGGYAHDTTPNLAHLAAQPGAVLFEKAYTSASWSLPAYASLFTGQDVLTHGLGFTRDTIVPTTRTLPEVFQAYGYQTRALCSGPHLVPDLGFSRGFDDYLHETNALPITNQVTDALRWLETDRDPDAPFFLFLQGYDAHFPYATPAVMSELFASEPIVRPEGGCARACGAARKNNGWRCVPQGLQDQGSTHLSPGQLDHVIAHYDSAVYYADYQLGRLLRGLERLGLYDDVILVVLSDHGEGLGEEGRLSHDWDCGEDIFHVPLVVRMPTDAPPIRRTSVVSLSGVSSTLLELVGIDPPVDADAEPFTALLSPDGADQTLGLARSASKQCYTVRTADWRYTESWEGRDWTPLPPRLQANGTGEDRSAEEPAQTASLAAELAGWPRGMDLIEINERAAHTNDALRQALQDGGYWSASSEEAPAP